MEPILNGKHLPASALRLQPGAFQPSQFDENNISDLTSASDVYEDEGVYKIELSMPTWNQRDLIMEVNEGILTVSIGLFNRSFRLPKEIFEDDITVSYNDGRLHIVVPKMRPWSLRSSEAVISGKGQPKAGMV